MSYSLAAKLYIGVTGHYEMASGLLGSLKTSDVSSELRRYLSEGIVLYKVGRVGNDDGSIIERVGGQ